MASDPRFESNPYQASQLSYGGVEASGTADLAPVQRGVSLVYLALVLLVLFILGMMVLGFVAASAQNEAFIGLMAYLPVVGLAISALAVYGRILCMAAPAETGAKGIITTAVVFDVISMVVTILQLVIVVNPILAGMTNLLSIIAYVLFVVFLKRLAYYIRQPELGAAAQSVLNYLIAIVVVWIAVIASAILMIPLLAIVGGLALLVLGLVSLVAYARLLSNMKEALREA